MVSQVHLHSHLTNRLNRTLNSGVKGSGANHYPRAPAQLQYINNQWINSTSNRDYHSFSTLSQLIATLNRFMFKHRHLQFFSLKLNTN